MNKYIDLGNGKMKVLVEETKYEGGFIIDCEDYDLIKNHTWYLKPARTNQADTHYVTCSINGKTVRLHRLLTNAIKGEIVDHLDRDPLNNSRSNLVKGTHSDNMRNMSKKVVNTSGRTGVMYKEEPGTRWTDKWVAQANYNGKRYAKQFSIGKYGYEEAYKLAVAQREAWEKEFNINNEK